jgi:MFS family permease
MDEHSLEQRPWFTPGVRGIGLASLLSDLGHEVPTSLLPRFVTSTLGGSAATLGIIEGVADALAGISRLAGGALADDPERRRAAAVGGYTSTAVLSGLIGAATSLWQVSLLRSGAWISRGIRVPSRNALLADATPPEAYGRAYGFERMMDNLGAIGGPLLALALVAAFTVRTAILLSIIPGLLAAVAIVYAIRHLPKLARRERQPIRLQVRPVMKGRLGRLMVSATAFELGNAAATLLILRTTDLLTPTDGGNVATEIALLLYTAYNAAATLVSLPAGHMNDRIGSVRAWQLGAAAFFGSYMLFASSGTSVPLLTFAFVLAGVGIGFAETAQSAAVAASAPPRAPGVRVRAARRRAGVRQSGRKCGGRTAVDLGIARGRIPLSRCVDACCPAITQSHLIDRTRRNLWRPAAATVLSLGARVMECPSKTGSSPRGEVRWRAFGGCVHRRGRAAAVGKLPSDPL